MARYRKRTVWQKCLLFLRDQVSDEQFVFLAGLLAGIALGCLVLFLFQMGDEPRESAGKEPLSVTAEAQRKGGGGFGQIPEELICAG